MPPPRKRRRKLQRYDIKGARIQGERAILTNNREVALLKLRQARKMGGSGGGTAGGGGGGGDLGRRLREAAQVIADQAKENASGWSARIPPSITVSGGGTGVSILSDAPSAYPNEVAGVRHPVFGGRGTRRPKAPWVLNQHRPFLAPAADQRGDEAAEKFSKVLDDWAKEHGYK